jgi:hypothetical protein
MSGLAVSQDIASRLQQAQRHHRQPQHVLILGILTLTAVQNEDAENARVCCIYVPSPTPARADARAAICAPGVCMHWPSNLTSSTAFGSPTNHRLFLWAHAHNSLQALARPRSTRPYQGARDYHSLTAAACILRCVVLAYFVLESPSPGRLLTTLTTARSQSHRDSSLLHFVSLCCF